MAVKQLPNGPLMRLEEKVDQLEGRIDDLERALARAVAIIAAMPEPAFDPETKRGPAWPRAKKQPSYEPSS